MEYWISIGLLACRHIVPRLVFSIAFPLCVILSPQKYLFYPFCCVFLCCTYWHLLGSYIRIPLLELQQYNNKFLCLLNALYLPDGNTRTRAKTSPSRDHFSTRLYVLALIPSACQCASTICIIFICKCIISYIWFSMNKIYLGMCLCVMVVPCSRPKPLTVSSFDRFSFIASIGIAMRHSGGVKLHDGRVQVVVPFQWTNERVWDIFPSDVCVSSNRDL